jgi:hypothetical protein
MGARSQMRPSRYDRRFSKIELLGYTSDGIHKSSKSRPFWRCEARRAHEIADPILAKTKDIVGFIRS